MKKRIIILYISVVTIFYTGCLSPENEFGLHNNKFNCVTLDYSELFYTFSVEWFQNNLPFQNDVDSMGISISLLPHGGTTWYYNPVNVGFWGMHLLDRYLKMEDSLYLDYAFRHRDKLVELMNEDGYLEYRLDYNHYDRTYNSPWYSGIAQGQALSTFSRLAYYAHDSLSEAMAHKVYETLNPYNDISNEVVFIDSAYAWIEEYPHDPPDHTFGGFMRAIVGVYDYYHLLSHNRKTAQVLSIYLTTIEDNMYRFRCPEGVYYYDLVYKRQYSDYHQIQIMYLNFLTKITQDSSFAIFADTLKSDYWEEDWGESWE